MQANGKFLLVTLTPPKTHTPGGLALPQKSTPDQNSGTVESIGPEVKEIVTGKTVYFRPISTYKVNDRLLAVHVDDVLAYE